jgi:hypothetical protein
MKEEMELSAPLSAKRERREDDDDESRRGRKLEKEKASANKDTDKEPFVDDTKFTVDLFKSTFNKL